MTPKQKRTLFFLYCRQISAGLLIYQPVFFPFLESRGIDAAQFAVLLIAYNIGTLALVIPAGRFADRAGKKWALLTANITYVIGTAMLAFGHSFYVFVAAEVLYSLAVALDLSTHSAFLYEFLRVQGKESEYSRYDAFGMFMFLVIGAIGTFCGGYLADYDLQLPVIVTMFTVAMGIPCALMLDEPVMSATAGEVERPDLQNIPILSATAGKNNRVIFRIARLMITNSGLRWAIVLNIIWLWSRQFVNLYLPGPYFKYLDLAKPTYGKLAAALTLTAGLIALFARQLMQRPDIRVVALLGLFLIPINCFIMSLAEPLGLPKSFGLLGYYLYSIPIGLATSVTLSLLNRQFAEHRHRTTFLAMVDFCTRLTASSLFFWLGRIIKDPSRGVTVALFNAGTITGVIAIILLPGIFRYASGKTAK